MIYLDSHVVIWLYEKKLELFSQEILQKLENSDLFISPMVILEMQYLLETKRLKSLPVKIIQCLESEVNLQTCEKSFSKIIQKAISYSWTRDPFDRLITAQAALDNNLFITKDKEIRSHYKSAIW